MGSRGNVAEAVLDPEIEHAWVRGLIELTAFEGCGGGGAGGPAVPTEGGGAGVVGVGWDVVGGRCGVVDDGVDEDEGGEEAWVEVR